MLGRMPQLKFVIKAVDEATGPLKKIGGRLEGLGGFAAKAGKAMAAGLAVGVGAITAMGAVMGKLFIDAIPLEGIKTAFEGITEAAGVSAEVILTDLRKATAGMVRDTELMKQYNLAAQLVSKTFANDMPRAMGPITKIAAATGESVDFLMDSYIRGIGRLSPMILDNLGIQVDLNQAYEDYAAANGLVASELTKVQQQSALAAQVNEKLLENTADMPEVTGTAAAAWGQLRTVLQNTKDQIGLALIPVLTPLIEQLGVMAAEYLPKLVEWFQNRALPAMVNFGEYLGENLPSAIATVKSFWDNQLYPFLRDAVEWFGKVVNAIKRAINILQSFISRAKEAYAAQPGAWGMVGGEVRRQERQFGGPVAAGMPYLVGERGPELFVPHRSGRIVPGHRGGRDEAVMEMRKIRDDINWLVEQMGPTIRDIVLQEV